MGRRREASDGMGRDPGGAVAAERFRRPGWREPRLLAGLGLIAVAVVATTATVAYGDSTEPFAVAAHDLEVGAPIRAEDLRTADLRLEGMGESYISGADQLREGDVVVDRVPEGRLVPREAIGRAEDIDRRPVGLPLATPMPAGTQPGDRVDVWVTERQRAGGSWGDPRRILEGVELAAVEDSGGGLAADGEATAQVLVESDDVAEVVGALAGESRLTLVPHLGGGR